jgi:hypothetical protein
MKRLWVGAAGGLAIVVCVLVSQPQVFAGPAIATSTGGECGMPGADEDGNMIFGGVGEKTTEIENGNRVTMRCKGTGITNDSGRMQTFSGFSCGISMADGSIVVTQDSRASVSARGVGTMTCTYVK